MKYKIKTLRVEHGMSQESLSEASGVSRAIISALESGREVTTTTETLSKLAKTLGVNVSDIFLE